jgi:sugar phosphate isomerase/epimerase
VLYHNEFPEFANGRTEMDELIRGTDPALVNFILDAGHCFHAGADPVAFFRKHHARLAAMHLRDFTGDEQVPLGQGKFPLAALARAIRETKWSGWLMNEEERVGSRPGDAAIAPAHEVLVKTFGGTI